MEHYALAYETKTAIRITQSHIAYTKIQDAPGRRGQGAPSRSKPFLAYDNGRTTPERQEHEVQTVDPERPASGQPAPVPPWNVRGSPYHQASGAYYRNQMLMELKTPYVVDIWA